MDDLQKKLTSCLKEVRRIARIGERRAWANDTLFRGECVCTSSDEGRKLIAKAFLVALEHRQRHGKECIDFQRYYYYIAKNGRLAYVSRQRAYTLIKRGKIVDFEATEEIKCGVYVSHRRVINAIEREGRRLSYAIKPILEHFFDEQLPCKMIIDTNFEKAYAPMYNESTSTDGDLATGKSCMSCRGSDAEQFYGGIEGCKVARFENDYGEQVGRCIVYEYNGIRHFIRIYGKGVYHRSMINHVKDSLKPNDLFGRDEYISGLELKTNWTMDTPNMYLDGSEYGIAYHTDDDKWYVTTDYDYECNSVSDDSIGSIYDDDFYRCKSCGRTIHRNDAYWVEDSVYCDSDCAANDGWHWCDCCDEAFREEDLIRTYDNEYSFCCERCANRQSYYMCEDCGEYFHTDDLFSDEGGDTLLCEHCLKNSNDYELNEEGYVVPKNNDKGDDDEQK